MDRSNVSLEMFATMEAFSTALDFAHVHARVCLVGVVNGAVAPTEFCGYPAATTFFRKVRDWYRKCAAWPGTTPI